MTRLTQERSNKSFYVDEAFVKHVPNGFTGEAVSKLAKYENFFDDLVAEQRKISMELEELRLEGKTHSVKFKQLLANKMMNNSILTLLKKYEL